MHNLRESVWKANLSLWENKLVYGTQGNVSGIDRKKKFVFIKPSGVNYGNLKKEDIISVDLEGKVTKGKLKPSVDMIHHLFLYKNIPYIGGVCHTHSKFLTVFSVLKINIPVLTTAHADVFGKEIPVTEYVDNTGDNIGKIFIGKYKKTKCPSIILGNHGLFSIGENPEESAFYAVMAEYCAETSFYAMVSGKILDKEIPPIEISEIKKWFDRYHSERYGQKEKRWKT
ncbi:MAG: class II aldolase/adducin family protein [Candidatus Omnitrophica bacterium]|nr:class II aldolase/adducin family protein [Candidatus Omnitrophota bacterium]